MASLGAPSGMAAQLSQSEIDALRARLMALWSPPVGVQDPNELIVNVTIKLRRDGRLAAAAVCARQRPERCRDGVA